MTTTALYPRLRAMLLGWGCVGIAYSMGAALHGGFGMLIAESWIDQALLPFTPAAVWPYLSFFLLVPLAYLACPAPRLQALMRAMQLCALVSGCVFLLWPTTLHYPSLDGEGWSLALLRLLSALDSSHNCLPSLHGALTLLAVSALLDAERPLRSAAVLAWGGLLAASIVMSRRHLALDLSAGLLLGALAAVATGLLPMGRRRIDDQPEWEWSA
jgi:hypothetical protein